MIDNLRQKPADVRNRMAIFISIGLTFLIVVLWLLIVKNKRTDDDVTRRSVGEDLKPLMMIFGGTKGKIETTQNNIKSIKFSE